MYETECSELVHWDDPEGWDGEAGGRGDLLVFYKTLGDLIGSIAVTAGSAYHHRSSGSSRHGM